MTVLAFELFDRVTGQSAAARPRRAADRRSEFGGGSAHRVRLATGLRLSAVLLVGMAFARSAAANDVVEFLSGAKVEGTVSRIDKEKKLVTFEARIAGRTISREYRYAQIHAVTYQGTRYVITERAAAVARPAAPAGAGGGGAASGARTRAEVESTIKQAGETAPDWFDTTPLNYPKTLDLSWPLPAPKGWNNQQNIGQFIWDIINPNPGRWRQGTRLMHHLLEHNKNDRATSQRIMNELGRMYHDLLEDYPRAAYWWRRAGVDRSDDFGRSGPQLAECYWRMGSREMAVELLTKLSQSNRGDVLTNCIKLWGDIGDLNKARTMADRLTQSYHAQKVSAGFANLNVGDACRLSGRYDDAIRYYQKVLNEPDDFRGRVAQNKNRARASIDAIKLFELCDLRRIASGTYSSSAMGYEDTIHVEVEVDNHEIKEVRITQHKEKQFYSAMTDTPAKIIAKNGVQGVDATSSATITSEAIINATAKALAGGQ